MDFGFSDRAKAYIERLTAFMDKHVLPSEGEYYRTLTTGGQRWNVPTVMQDLKYRAKAEGLWNLFMPESAYGPGLSNVEYAPLAEITGRVPFAPEIFNCNAPDTGNMEVLTKYGSPMQKERWLKPLLDGSIRSAFCMTEPDVASSDATNMEATAIVKGARIVLNGRKWWSTGIGHPDCRILIFMGLTDPQAPRHARHSMVLLPVDTQGVEIGRMLPVFGMLDEPYGHGEVSFTDVEVPLENVIAGPGKGFEIAQGRLGPGRIHHCMRAIGAAEHALELLCRRALTRTAFGKPLSSLGGNVDVIANVRIAIEQARLLTLKAAWLMDTVGVKGEMSEISQIKVVAPAVAQAVVDAAIQIHGAAGVCEDYGLTGLFAYARALRIADGPDEVHRALIARLELRAQAAAAGIEIGKGR